MPESIRELIGKAEREKMTAAHDNTLRRYEDRDCFPQSFYSPTGHRLHYRDEVAMWVRMNYRPRTAENSRARVDGKPVQGGTATVKSFAPEWNPEWMDAPDGCRAATA